MKRFLFDCGTRDGVASLGLFALRAMAGLMLAIGHGWVKIHHFDSILKKGFYVPDFLPLSLMSPHVSLIATICAEFGAALLVVFGFMTRLSAFVVAFTMTIAAFAVNAKAPFFSAGEGPSKELAIMYLLPMIVLILTGGGGWSLDAAMFRDPKRRRW